MKVQSTEVPVDAPVRRVPSVEVYDFRRPTTLAREHSRILELAFDTFARQWGTLLTAKVRVISQVTSEYVMMTSYDEYAASLPAETAMVLCAMPDVAAKAVVQFPTSAALGWVDHMLGGSGGFVAPERKFTQIEQALVRRLIDDTLEDLHYSLGSLLVDPLQVTSIEHNSQFAQAAATADLMIVARFTVRVGERSAPATIAIPGDVLLPQLGEANPVTPTANVKALMNAQLAQVPVDVSLQLTPANITPGEVLSLAVGDVLPLPHPEHRPFFVAVDGHPLARAAVGANGSRLACVVVESGAR